MDPTEIIKRRLTELKRMSIQLKQSTQNSSQLDYNIVYSILQATKSSASKLTQLQQIQTTTSRESSPLAKLLAMNSTTPYKSLFPQTVQEKRQKLTHGHGSSTKASTRLNKQSSDPNQNLPLCQDAFYEPNEQPFEESGIQFIGSIRHQPKQPYTLTSEQQVSSLRQQNANLQKSLSTVRQQLHELKDKLNSLQKQQEWKAGLPYFKLSQKISAFYTRMRIHENDYHKIDYVTYDAELTLNKLVITKPNITQKQLDLTELREVHYVDSIVIFLHFGIAETEKPRNVGNKQEPKNDKTSSDDFFQNLFIKFNNEEQLHQWDLALYINFKIVESLKKDKLFQNHLRRSRSRSPKRSSESKHYDSHKKSKRSSDHILEDQDLMKKLIERRELYQETKKLVSERMIEKANEKKLLNSAGGNKLRKDQIYGDADEYSETHPFDIAANDEMVSSNGKFNYVVRDENGYDENEGEKSERANTSKFRDIFASGKINSTAGQTPTVLQPNLPGISSTPTERGPSFNPGQHELSLSRKLEEERVNETTEAKRQQDLKAKRIQQVIKKFIDEGYDLTKYSKDGFNPHDKRFFLSADLKQLCWEEEGAKNKKSIRLDSIKEVMLEKIGEGIRKHIKKPKRQEHSIISYIKEGKMKVIELGANSTVMAQFVDELITVIDHLKGTGH